MSKIGSYSKRIEKEISALQKNPDGDLGIYKVFPDKKTFYAFFKGPSDSPFENGYYKLFVHLKDDYPFSAPYMKFMTKVYHPNISSQTGAICIDILKDKWTAALSIRTALLSISALLTDPVPDDPQDHMVSIMYVDHRAEYDQTAKEWTDKYAKKDVMTENELLIEELSKEYDVIEVVNHAARNVWERDNLLALLEKGKKK